jgi:hypothetical protein
VRFLGLILLFRLTGKCGLKWCDEHCDCYQRPEGCRHWQIRARPAFRLMKHDRIDEDMMTATTSWLAPERPFRLGSRLGGPSLCS